LTHLAQEGKLDPVVGRESEVLASSRCCLGAPKTTLCRSAKQVSAKLPS
jgi:hypothetical protein